MGRFAVLSEGFEHLSYPLGREEAADKKTFSDRKEKYCLHRAISELHAQMALGASDALSEHASLPVGYVSGGQGEFYLVCRRGGKKPSAAEMPLEERRSFSLSVVRRLSALHAAGLCCGGLSPEAVEFSGKEARLLDPSRLFATSESDAIFFEAVATLCSLLNTGFAKEKEIPSLASAYLASSPVCREGVQSHIREKGWKTGARDALARSALKYASYF
jgi:hypothetical protein